MVEDEVGMRELAVLERDFYVKRFESGQQRGLVVVTTSSALVAVFGAVSAFLPEDQPVSSISIVGIALAMSSFVVAAVIAVLATGPAFTKKDQLPAADMAESLAEGSLTEEDFLSGTSASILKQAQGLRRAGNRQARRVRACLWCQAAGILLLAVAALMMASEIAG